MNEPKHTHGPWEQHGLAIYKSRSSIKLGQLADEHTAEVWTGLKPDHNNNLSYEEAEANARLIAAAPELLAALVDLEEWAQIPDNGSKDAVILRNKVRAAIAKATGGK